MHRSGWVKGSYSRLCIASKMNASKKQRSNCRAAGSKFAWNGTLRRRPRVFFFAASLNTRSIRWNCWTHLVLPMLLRRDSPADGGDGELRAECEAFVSAHDLPVSFTGFLNQSEIVRAYVAADCLVLPSDAGETWGLVVNEAMACGLPAIVSNQAGCAADLVVPGVTGEVFSFGCRDELSALLGSMGRDRDRLARMGTNAHRHIQSYSSEKAAQGIQRAVADGVCASLMRKCT